ncbi:hypothetical protein ACLQ3C_12540 [Gordonia sp. DT30]
MLAVAVVAGIAAYLFWPRRVTPSEWAEFERRAAAMRSAVQELAQHDPTPRAAQRLHELDKEYAQIQTRYAPSSSPLSTG